MNALLGDLRHALRSLLRSPTLAALAVLTLALGIGANTAIFSVLHAVLLAPLPYPQADRLVMVWNTYPLMGLPQATVSVPDYFDRREGVAAFEESALFTFQSFNLTAEGTPERVVGVRSTASLFPLLRANPLLGSAFGEEHDRPGHENVVVISHGLWQRAFGAERGLVGREVLLNGAPHRVLGVMPPEFAFPHPRVEIWKPFAATPEQRADESRGHEYSQMAARLAAGATLEQAQAQIDAIHEANKERFPQARDFWESSGFGGRVVGLREDRYGELRPLLLLLQGMVVLVLLIACFNVASLLLTRLAARRRELAVRTALGAGAGRLARQLLAESLLLALAGGAAGAAVGWLGVRALPRLGLDPAASGLEVGLSLPVLLFALALALITGVVFGLFPVVSLRRTDPGEVLKEGGKAGGGRRASRVRRALVVAEVAMALVLLVGAGLFVRTFAALQSEDPGFDHDNVLLAQVALPEARYGEDAQVVAFFDRTLEKLRALPGVTHAGLVSSTPFSGSSSSGSYEIEGYQPGPGEAEPHALTRVVDDAYFRALEIPVHAGRTFDRSDTAEGEPVVVIDRTLVARYFEEGEPLAGRLRRGGDDAPWFRIVGVVGTVKIRDLDQPVVKETLYVSYRQRPSRNMTFVVKTAGDPAALAQPLRQAVQAVDTEQPVYGVTTLEEQIADTLRERRASMWLLAIFGALAAVLAAVGLYGVLAFGVAQRQREIGTRMALGAAPGRILRLVLGQGLVLAAAGVAAGTLLALAGGRAVAAMLFGVRPWDPATFAAVAAALVAVALAACYRPARRAARIDPMNVLRVE